MLKDTIKHFVVPYLNCFHDFEIRDTIKEDAEFFIRHLVVFQYDSIDNLRFHFDSFRKRSTNTFVQNVAWQNKSLFLNFEEDG